MPKIAAIVTAAVVPAAPAAAAAAVIDCGIAPMLPEPTITTAPTASPGKPLTLRGTDWTDGAGCGPVTLRARLDGRSIRLGTTRLQSDGSFVLVWSLPESTQAGKLVVSARQACEGIDSAARVAVRVPG